jgi:F-type H+-transporting ATPase subunit epsilon
MQVTVISPEAAMFEGQADAIIAPATDGDVGILPNHAPYMTLLGRGTLVVRQGAAEHRFTVRGGFLQVVHNRVRVVAEHVQGGVNAA